jgi:hypothetical protein
VFSFYLIVDRGETMKFKGIYTQPTKKEKEFFIKHIEELGVAKTVAVDENGNMLIGGYLFRIDESGIYRYTGVNPEFGFKLDEHGRIVDVDF